VTATPLVTVLVPTYDHGPTLRHSVASALAQELDGDIEVLIVGDGMPPAAAAVARELAERDRRVRVFEFEKGPRNGEVHRDAVLASEAGGEYVLYLSDDDLWLPDHAAKMVAALQAADFAAATAALVYPDGRIEIPPHDLSQPGYRALMLDRAQRWNHVPLSAAGHTMKAYRRSEGWTTSPDDVWSDLHFYRGLLEADWVRAASCGEVTCLVFPSPERRGVSPDERATELEPWAAKVADPGTRLEVQARVDAAYRAQAAGSELLLKQAHDHARRLEVAIAARDRRLRELEVRLGAIEATRTWRARERADVLRQRARRVLGRR
jgi:hypothetical protein